MIHSANLNAVQQNYINDLLEIGSEAFVDQVVSMQNAKEAKNKLKTICDVFKKFRSIVNNLIKFLNITVSDLVNL